MPPLIAITDADDPRIAAYRAVRERDLVGRAGLFIAEGAVVLRVLLAKGRFRVASILLAEGRIEGVQEILALAPADVPVYTAAQKVMDAIAGFPIHRGILAVGDVGQPLDAREMLAALPARAMVLGLNAIANHDNMGGIFRNAAAFGASAVLLDTDCCDPLYRKAIRVSVGAALKIPFARAGNASQMVELLAQNGFEVLSLSPAGQQRLVELAPAPRSALLLGAEGPGLPADVLARTTSIRIDMADGFDSLNVATTSGIALHHISTAQG